MRAEPRIACAALRVFVRLYFAILGAWFLAFMVSLLSIFAYVVERLCARGFKHGFQLVLDGPKTFRIRSLAASGKLCLRKLPYKDFSFAYYILWFVRLIFHFLHKISELGGFAFFRIALR
jgi:hypothetical protein